MYRYNLYVAVNPGKIIFAKGVKHLDATVWGLKYLVSENRCLKE